jgi:hypothetical protein
VNSLEFLAGEIDFLCQPSEAGVLCLPHLPSRSRRCRLRARRRELASNSRSACRGAAFGTRSVAAL